VTKILLFFLACTILITWPSAIHLKSNLIGDGGDNYQYFGFQHIFKTSLLAGQYPFQHQTVYRYPFGFDFGLGYDGLFSIITGSLFSLALDPVISYNLTVWLIFVTNCVTAYLLGFRLSRSRLIGIFSGISWGFNFYNLARGGSHLNLQLTAGFPLLILGLMQLKKKINTRSQFLFWFSLILLSLGSLQYLFLALIIICIYLLYLLAVPPRTQKTIRTSIPHMIIGFLSFSLVFYALYFPYIHNLIKGRLVLENRQETYQKFSVSPIDLIIPNPYLHTWFSTYLPQLTPSSIESSIFLGYVEPIMVMFFIWSKAPWRQKLFWLSLGAIFLFPTVNLGYHRLFPLLFFRAIPEPSRFVILVQLSTLMMSTLLLAGIRHQKYFRVITLILILAVLTEKVSFNYYQVPSPLDPYQSVISEQPGKAVLQLPLDQYDQLRNASAAYHRKNIVDGYLHWSANEPKTLQFIESAALDRFLCVSDRSLPLSATEHSPLNSELIRLLKKYQILTILIKNDGRIYHGDCLYAHDAIQSLLPPTFVAQDTDGRVINKLTITSQAPRLSQQIYFDRPGALNLAGFLISPPGLTDVKLQVNETLVPLRFTGVTKYGLSIEPVITKFRVPAGSNIIISSDQILNMQTTYVTTWYEFSADKDSKVAVPPPIEQIYQSTTARVFRVN